MITHLCVNESETGECQNRSSASDATECQTSNKSEKVKGSEMGGVSCLVPRRAAAVR